MYSGDEGDTFCAKYKILEKIGEGSFSEVVKCMNRSTGVLYAAKRLKKFYKSESGILTCAEVVAAQKIPFHSNILNILEYHYGLCEQKAKEYLYQVLRGLEHLHRNGLFHRDVKPENILIKFPSIETVRLHNLRKHEVVKLADLGSVRGVYSVPPYTEYISTRWYRSPECLLSNGHYGPKMDVWALGCVFYEMITLLPLFPGANEVDQLHKIHQVLGSPTMQFLSKLKSRSRNCVVFPKVRGTGLDNLLTQVSREGRGVLELMVQYDPDKRVNIRRLLRNVYFDDVRYKFEPTMEGSGRKPPESRGKRSSSDTKGSKAKIVKREQHWGDSKSRSAASDSSSTPSIEIPYYMPRGGRSSGKGGSLPLVDFKISKCVDGSDGISRESGGSLSRKSNVKKSVEIILRSSRNSESNKSETRNVRSKSLAETKKTNSGGSSHVVKLKNSRHMNKLSG